MQVILSLQLFEQEKTWIIIQFSVRQTHPLFWHGVKASDSQSMFSLPFSHR